MKRQRHTADKTAKTIAAIQKRASRALVGRTITLVDLHLLPEESGEISHGCPRIMFDDGTVLVLEVHDHGSGTYGVLFATEKP